MYAHKVIDSLKKLKQLHKGDDQALKYHAGNDTDSQIKNILDSQKFHIGDFDDIRKVLKNKAGQRTFIDDDCTWGVRLPYNLCWFDYISYDAGNIGHKRGLLVKELKPDLLLIRMFNEIKTPNYPLEWSTNLFYFYISIGMPFCDRPDIDEITPLAMIEFDLIENYNKAKQAWINTPFFPVPVSKFYEERLFSMDARTWAAGERHLSENFTALNATLMFLNCKNIEYFENHPPEKLNKKRIKNKKTPLFTYKTLVLAPATKKQKSLENQGLWENRVHLCRGHFKTYTEANPLFGKYTGRYWWQPFARGNKEQGVVMKDYKVSGLSGAGGGAG